MGALIMQFVRAIPSLSGSAMRSISSVAKKYPTLTATFGTLGINGVIDMALSGDKNAIDMIVESAAIAGIKPEAGLAMATGLQLANNVYNKLPKEFKDASVIKVDADEFEQIESYKKLANFLRSEVSSDPGTVVRYHAYMREFLQMDQNSVQRIVGAFM